MHRYAGINLPLSAVRSRTGWGIGEISDLRALGEWLNLSGIDELLILPLGTMAEGQASPYSAVSTLSIDPLYISLAGVEDFQRSGGVSRLSPEAHHSLTAARWSSSLALELVRRAKHEALSLAFQGFFDDDWRKRSTRAAAFAAYIDREHAWLDDYALFQALSRTMPGRGWQEWPEPLRARDAEALESARHALARDILQEQYLQWVGETQWRAARAQLRELGVRVIGDLPFVANTNSPEVWARQDEFDLGVSTGAPPDAFSATGQDWGLPFYRWDVIAKNEFAWIRKRAGRMASLFDGVRVDHVIGLYRTYGRPSLAEPFFSPAEQHDQVAQGETILRMVRDSGLEIIAEDLGLIPDFARESLARLEIPGCKVLRWERDWHREGAPFVTPTAYPSTSVAMTGTHDTTTLAHWWREAAIDERTVFLQLPALRDGIVADASAPWTLALRDAVLAMMYGSSSIKLFLPIQDIFGWVDRINTPGTVSERNWTWCLPWPIEDFDVLEDTLERAAFLRALASATARGPRI